MEEKKEYYIGGNQGQFAFSKNKDFIVKHTTPSFIYYKDIELSKQDDYWTSEKRLETVERIMLDKLKPNLTPEYKNKLVHCVLCIKWIPMNNASRYCATCPYSRESEK